MKSARINFGIPESEYILEVDDSGAATSLVNQDTGTEYVGIGGGSDLPEVTSADEGKVLAVNASGEWAAEQIIFRLIYDEDEGVFNLTPEQAFELFRTGVRIVWYEAYIDPEDTTTVYAERKEYVALFYDNGVYKLRTAEDSIVAGTFTSSFYID